MIRIQEAPFDVGAELAALTRGRSDIGALASFLGLVRDLAGDRAISAMTLEHYPGMTERKLAEIEAEAQARWPLAGEPDRAPLRPHAAGRADRPGRDRRRRIARRRSSACAFLIDWLKTKAPFWKLEETAGESRWVAARAADDEAAARWQERA